MLTLSRNVCADDYPASVRGDFYDGVRESAGLVEFKAQLLRNRAQQSMSLLRVRFDADIEYLKLSFEDARCQRDYVEARRVCPGLVPDYHLSADVQLFGELLLCDVRVLSRTSELVSKIVSPVHVNLGCHHPGLKICEIGLNCALTGSVMSTMICSE